MDEVKRTRIIRHLPPLVLLALAVGVSGCARTMIATPSLYTETDTALFEQLAPELQGNLLPVLYATDRLPETGEDGGGLTYGNKRSASGALGLATVRIKETGQGVDATGTPASAASAELVVESVDERVRFPATPYLYRVKQNGRIEIDPEVAAGLDQTMAKARREIAARLALTSKKEVYLYVHGVNVTFDEAVLSTAEFWHFLGREGVPIIYTWPAGASGLLFYTVDRESGEYTLLHLKQFLKFLAGMPEIEKLHIVAHSRGTDIAVTAMRELIIAARAAGRDPLETFKVENLILVAADIDAEVEMQRVVGEAMAPAFGRVTIYSNAEDKALAAASSLFDSRQRLGTLTPTALTPQQRQFMAGMANLDVIVYEGAGGGFLRHGYYTDPAVSSDIIAVLRYGWRPGEGKRQGLEKLGDNTWRLGSTDAAQSQ